MWSSLTREYPMVLLLLIDSEELESTWNIPYKLWTTHMVLCFTRKPLGFLKNEDQVYTHTHTPHRFSIQNEKRTWLLTNPRHLCVKLCLPQGGGIKREGCTGSWSRKEPWLRKCPVLGWIWLSLCCQNLLKCHFYLPVCIFHGILFSSSSLCYEWNQEHPVSYCVHVLLGVLISPVTKFSLNTYFKAKIETASCSLLIAMLL